MSPIVVTHVHKDLLDQFLNNCATYEVLRYEDNCPEILSGGINAVVDSLIITLVSLCPRVFFMTGQPFANDFANWQRYPNDLANRQRCSTDIVSCADRSKSVREWKSAGLVIERSRVRSARQEWRKSYLLQTLALCADIYFGNRSTSVLPQ